MRETSRVLEIFCILIWVVTQVLPYVKLHHIVHLKINALPYKSVTAQNKSKNKIYVLSQIKQ